MKKSCYICKHSEEVSYNWKTNYGYGSYFYYKDNKLFCLASPPSNKSIAVERPKITSGYNKLRRYCQYPLVSNTACCSLYCKTDIKKKIKRYEEILNEEKLKKQNIQKENKKARLKKASELEAIKAKKQEEKKEKLRKKKRLESQKRYRAKKKAENLEQLKKAEEYNRFDILDL